LGVGYPCPVPLRTGCCPDEGFLGLLHSELQGLLEQLVLARPAQLEQQPLELPERLELEQQEPQELQVPERLELEQRPQEPELLGQPLARQLLAWHLGRLREVS
jgi:hypothetical protein